VKFFPMTNRDASPVTYRLDPQEQLRVSDEMDAEGWELLGIFHTHTHSEAYPSETDKQRAFWPGTNERTYPDAAYLVLSLSDRANPVLRAFRIGDDGEIAEEDLVIA
jgi:proteasome lid subunit RPN8/RPN11